MKIRNLSYLLFFLLALPPFVDAQNRTPKREVEKQLENVASDRITIHELKRKMDVKEKIVIIDTRKGSAWIGSLVKIKGAIHLTLDELETKINDLPKEKEIITYCT
jgi:Rhodanese-like domain